MTILVAVIYSGLDGRWAIVTLAIALEYCSYAPSLDFYESGFTSAISDRLSGSRSFPLGRTEYDREVSRGIWAGSIGATKARS